MKIDKVQLRDFMLFENLTMQCSKNINVICGSNSTGKTAILKLLYAMTEAYGKIGEKPETKEQLNARFVEKLTHVFRPEDMSVGRLARRRQGSSRAEGTITFSKGKEIKFGFGNKQSVKMDLEASDMLPRPIKPNMAIYFPPKEIISATENFASLYQEFNIAFEETYYDLARLLMRPLKRGPNTGEQNAVVGKLGDIMGGSIIQKENKFYLKTHGQGEFEMGLVSEGYRKLATIVYLILNGSLSNNSILFWDEPETNMNPRMIQSLVEAVIELAKMGVQIFITTHDYFLQQYFNLYAAYPEENRSSLAFRFVSLYKAESGEIEMDAADTLSDLKHNPIMEEFDAIYDYEQRMLLR